MPSIEFAISVSIGSLYLTLKLGFLNTELLYFFTEFPREKCVRMHFVTSGSKSYVYTNYLVSCMALLLNSNASAQLQWIQCFWAALALLCVMNQHGFCTFNRFCWRCQIHDAAVQQQFLGISGKCSASQNSCAAEPLELCCEFLQDFWVYDSKTIETQSLTSWHNCSLSEILEKSSKSPHWESCPSERDCVMCKHGYLLSLKTNVDFSGISPSHPGKGRCHILCNANLGCAGECSTESPSSMNRAVQEAQGTGSEGGD